MMVFDLDPGAPADIVDCCRVGLWLRDLFADLGLECFAKTSGSKGLQVYVPLNVETSYDETKPFSRAVAELLEKQHPEHVVSRMTKSLRPGQGARRLEPERRAQDDRQRLLPAREGAPHGLDAGELGGGGGVPAQKQPRSAYFHVRPGPRPRGRAGRPVRAGTDPEAGVADVLRLRSRRREARSWSRRLVDDESRGFVEDELEETRELYRTSAGEFLLEPLCRHVFASAPTTDIRWLKDRGIDGERFYREELAPNWEGLDREERAQRVERFIDLSNQLGAVTGNGTEPAPELRDLIATVHVKVILLAWAFDRTHGFVDRIFNGPLQYRLHRAGAG